MPFPIENTDDLDFSVACGIAAAQRHRARGVSLGMFINLMKGYLELGGREHEFRRGDAVLAGHGPDGSCYGDGAHQPPAEPTGFGFSGEFLHLPIGFDAVEIDPGGRLCEKPALMLRAAYSSLSPRRQ